MPTDLQLVLIVLGSTATRARTAADRLEADPSWLPRVIDQLRDISETLLELRAQLKESK